MDSLILEKIYFDRCHVILIALLLKRNTLSTLCTFYVNIENIIEI